MSVMSEAQLFHRFVDERWSADGHRKDVRCALRLQFLCAFESSSCAVLCADRQSGRETL
jgi:hypothetical protein